MKNNPIRLIVLLLIIFAGVRGVAVNGDSGSGEKCEKIIADSVPTPATKFVPSGWCVESLLAGKLSKKSTGIYIAVLTDRLNQTLVSKSNAGNRKLLVVVDLDGWRVSAIGDKALRCAKCYGALGGDAGGSPDVSFKEDVLTIRETGGSREMWVVAIRFRYDFDLNRFKLIDKKNIRTDRFSHSGNSSIVDYVNRTQVVEKFSFDEQGVRHTTRQTKKIRQIDRFIEDYDYESEDNP